MERFLLRSIYTLAAAAILAAPAGADTEFRAKKMTRNEVPFGKGQCDIRLRVDGEVEVSVRGDLVSIRTISGREPRDDGSECNEPLPIRPFDGLAFEVRDRRNDISLLSEPERYNGFRAVVRIWDSDGGEGRYHFRLSWQFDGGGSSRRDSDDRYGPGNRDSNDRYGPRDRGPGWRFSPDLAIAACSQSVRASVTGEYGYRNVQIRDAWRDERPGRADNIVGDATGSRGSRLEYFLFSCDVDWDEGRVVSADVRRR